MSDAKQKDEKGGQLRKIVSSSSPTEIKEKPGEGSYVDDAPPIIWSEEDLDELTRDQKE